MKIYIIKKIKQLHFLVQTLVRSDYFNE